MQLSRRDVDTGSRSSRPLDSSPTFELPPPGHLMLDILRLAGSLPCTPTQSDQILERFRKAPPIDEGTLVVRKSMGLPYTPLEELDKAVKDFFDEGPKFASCKFSSLYESVRSGKTVVDVDKGTIRFMGPWIAKMVPWNSCKLASTLVLLLASPPNATSMLEALKWQSWRLGGLPTMAEISSTASADLPRRFAQAKKAAIDGKIGKVTVLGVSLVDVEMIERGEIGSNDMNYTSFAHSFVLAIGREGFRVYQSWGKHGYPLDKFLIRGGSRLRTWEDAKVFLKIFKKLASSTKWSPELNSAYQELFEVDINSICGMRLYSQPPLVPVYRPWVRLFEINDVQVENIKKFTWKITE